MRKTANGKIASYRGVMESSQETFSCIHVLCTWENQAYCESETLLQKQHQKWISHEKMSLPLIEVHCTLLASITPINRLIIRGSNCEGNGKLKDLANFAATQAAQRSSARTNPFANYGFVQIIKKTILKLSATWAIQAANRLSVRAKTIANRYPATIVKKVISKPPVSWYAKQRSKRQSRALQTVI